MTARPEKKLLPIEFQATNALDYLYVVSTDFLTEFPLSCHSELNTSVCFTETSAHLASS